MLSTPSLGFKSPLAKKRATTQQVAQLNESAYTVSFKSVLRIRPLVGSEAEEQDNNILSVESRKAPELLPCKTPFNSPFPKALSGKLSDHSGKDECAEVVVLRAPSSVSFPSLPFPSSSANAKTCVKSVKKYAAGQLTAIVAGNEDRFQFDHVFGEQCTQHEFYESVGSAIVSEAISPLLSLDRKVQRDCPTNVVFSLGVSNSGKSHMLFGKHNSLDKAGNREDGLLLLMIEHLFSFFEGDKKEKTRGNFSITLSMMELHNEQVHDMLDPASNPASNMRSASPLRIHQHTESELFFVPGLTSQSFNTMNAAQNALLQAMQTAQVRATPQNGTSSRSHIIISIQPSFSIEGSNKCVNGGKIMIFDLAGVERTRSTATSDILLKESISINTSIKGVMSCLRALKWNQEHPEKKKIVPYRESKVAMLLQPVFSGVSGSAVATIIVSAYPGASDYAEKKYLLKQVSALRTLSVTEGVADKLKDWISSTTPMRSPNFRMTSASTSKKRKGHDRSIEDLLEENEKMLIENHDLKRQCEDLKTANSSLRQLLKDALKNKCEQNQKGELYYPETDEAKASRHCMQSLVPTPLQNHILDVQTNNNSWICFPKTYTNKPPFQLTVPYEIESNDAIDPSECKESEDTYDTHHSEKENIDIGSKRHEANACVSTRDRKKARRQNIELP